MKQNQDNLEQLKKLARVFNTQNIISSADIEEVLLGITKIMNSFKKDNEVINKETKDIVESLLDQSIISYNLLYKKIEDKIDSANLDYKTDTESIKGTLNDSIKKVEKLSKSIKALKLKNGKDGKDADEEVIVASVLERIELPEYKEAIADTGEQIIDKINEAPLTEDNKIDASRIKNLPQQNIVAGRNGITEAPKDNKIYGRKNRAWVEVTGGGGGGGGEWGSITGTLSDQTDLQSALNAKESTLNKSTDTALGNSDTLYPTQNAVKTYVDSKTYYENIGLNIQNGIKLITTGYKGLLFSPGAGTIQNYKIQSYEKDTGSDIVGSIQVTVKKNGTSIGTIILSTEAYRSETDLSLWTDTSLLRGDKIEFVVDSVIGVKNVHLSINTLII